MNYSLEEQIGQLVLIGFHGKLPSDPGVQKVLQQAEQGLITGVILFRYNIESREQLQALVQAFQNCNSPWPLLICVDQEGGKVQRVHGGNGFIDTLSAEEVARSMSKAEALAHYDSLGQELSSIGINVDFAPCVDLDSDPGCPVIGQLGRSYGSDVTTLCDFAEAMIEGLRKNGVRSCLKHFPGHGRACGDTHEGLIDITDSWSEAELEPYKVLTERHKADAVMSAHLIHREVDADHPATLSKNWLSKLRQEIQFKGPIFSDCLHMGAIINSFTLSQVVVKGLHAGLDVFVFSNNPLACGKEGIRHESDKGSQYVTLENWIVPDSDLPEKIQKTVLRGIQKGELTSDTVEGAFKRVIAFKEGLASGDSS